MKDIVLILSLLISLSTFWNIFRRSFSFWWLLCVPVSILGPGRAEGWGGWGRGRNGGTGRWISMCCLLLGGMEDVFIVILLVIASEHYLQTEINLPTCKSFFQREKDLWRCNYKYTCAEHISKFCLKWILKFYVFAFLKVMLRSRVNI